MRILSRASSSPTSGLPSWATIDEEALRLAAALEHVARHGNLDDFSETQSGKLALMATATRRGLVTWNRDASRYELTSLGRQHLGVRRNPASPPPPTAPASHPQVGLGSPFSPGALIAFGACVVLGVAVMAATLRSFDVEPQHPAAIQDKVASRQDNVPARIAAPAGADQVAAPAPAAGKAEQSKTSSATQPTAPAQAAPGSTPADIGYASSQPPSASPQESERPAPLPDAPSDSGLASQTTPTHSPTSDPVKRTPAAVPNGQRRLAATSRSIETPERDATNDIRASSETRRTSKSQRAAQHPSHTEARSHEKPSAGSAHDWSSGKTVDVARSGALVREERTLPGGKVVVRYQYGNGPAHFETRSKGSRARAPGYAFAGEHPIRLGRLDWLR